jgi:hypothetical protein
MILVSVDDHLVEPPNLFEGRIANKYADETPRAIRQSDGSEVWTFNGAIIPNIGLNAAAGRPREEYGVEPTAFDEMRPGCYDIHERIKDMNAGGVRSFDHGRFERTVGATLGLVSAKLVV